MPDSQPASAIRLDRPTREGDLTWEVRGMAPIPADGRYGGNYRMFTVWFAPNLVPAAFFVGTLPAASYIGLSFGWGIVAIVLGNLIGAILPAIMAVMGPRTGMAQLPLSRLVFGKTIVVPGLVNWGAQIIWDGLNGLFGAEALAILFHVPFWTGLIIIILLQGTLAVLGYEIIHQFQKWMSIVLFIVFAILTVKIISIGTVHISAATHGADAVGGFILMVTIVASFTLGWDVYASDYSRYMKVDTPWWSIVWRVVAGLCLSAGWLEVLGLMAARLATNSTSGGIYDLMGKGFLGVIALIAIALGTVAVDALDDYTGSLSLQATGINVPRPISAVLVGIGGFAMALYLHTGDIASRVTNVLLFLGYWTAPFAAIVLVHWWRHRGKLDVTGILNFSTLESGWAALACLLIGFAASAPFMDTSIYVGAVSKGPLHGGDLAYFVGFVVAGVLFAAAARLGWTGPDARKQVSKRQPVAMKTQVPAEVAE
jgi:nucleobase:cation symporter-1, NCS1 family